MRSEELVLGIDGGGSKTVAWLAPLDTARQPAVAGRGTAGPGNLQAVGLQRSIASLDQAVAAAFGEAGVAPAAVAAAVVALAGSDREENRRALGQWAEQRRLAHRFRVVNDGLPVLAAGTPDGWGVALICGTGSFCFGQRRDGRSSRAGGWGYLFGDEGSAYAVALAGLRAAAKAADGRGPATELLEAFMRRLRVAEAHSLVSAIYPMAADRAGVSLLAEVVATTAADGDAVARAVLDEAGGELAAMVGAVARNLDLPPEAFPLAMSGGLLLACGPLRDRLLVHLQSRRLRPFPLTTVNEPVAGAVALARSEAAG